MGISPAIIEQGEGGDFLTGNLFLVPISLLRSKGVLRIAKMVFANGYGVIGKTLDY